MATKIDSQTSRDNLKARHAPYWFKVRTSCHLGYRKTTAGSTGTWLARYRDESTGKYELHSLGALDSITPGKRYDEAFRLAVEWFDHRRAGGAATSITVAKACARYVQHLRDHGREASAKDAEARFRRWVAPNSRLGIAQLDRLTPAVLNDWRVKLSKTLVIPQDKSKTPTKPRAPGSINRDMAVIKAALNLALEDGFATNANAWITKLRPIKDADQRRERYLDADQRRALIAAAQDDLAPFLRALSLVPLRPGAMAALTAGSYDRRLNQLTVGKDKAGRDRKITLPASTGAFFSEQAKGKLPAAPLFTRADGKRWDKDAWKAPFKAAAAAAGLPPDAVTYNLRHSAITDLIALHRLDTMTVAVLSGTSLAMIEKHYGHLLRDHAAEGLAKLAL
jgi:integrase